jgi:endonuclease YncB( thermonuclease family)
VAVLAFLLLIAALVLFYVSTRQWTIWLRGAVWAFGALLLVFAALLLGSSARDPEFGAALGDLVAKWNRPGESMLMRMLESNGASVARIFLSLFDLFLFFAAVVGVLALIAFRPGEGLEKAIRPVMTGVIGAILGGSLALAIVGTGFGEREERSAYAGPVLSETVHDGDTLLLNGDLVDLRGVAAPELGQTCRFARRTQDCGAEAQGALRRMIEGAYVICAVDSEAPGGRTVTCSAVRPNGEEFNIAERLVEEGYAIGLGGAFSEEGADATARTRGLMAWCSVEPEAWTLLTEAQKDAFRDRGIVPEGTPMMGTCPQRLHRRGSNTPAVSAPD